MITDEIVEAMDMMIELCSDRTQAVGMDAMREMLCDLDVDNWPSMSEEERKEWMISFLNCQMNSCPSD